MDNPNRPEYHAAPTVANWVEEYKGHMAPRITRSTMTIIEQELRRFALFIGQKEISGRLIHEFMDEQFKRTTNGRTLTSKTVCWVKAFLCWTEEMGYLTRRYSSLLQPIPWTVKPALQFTREQYERLKAVSKGTVWYYASIMAYRTGARRSDVFMLKWEHVDLDNLVIRYVPFKSRKTGRYATCPFQAGGDLHEVLKEMSQSRDPRPHWNQFVCSELAMAYPMNGSATDIKSRLMDPFKKFCAQIGAPHLSFHKLRNSFMARLVNGGVPFAQARQITGLDSDSVFLRYAKPDIGVLRAAIEKADALENPPPAGENILALPAA